MANKDTVPADGTITRIECTDGIKVSLYGLPKRKLAVDISYDLDHWAEDRLEMREALAKAGHTAKEIENAELVFSNDPDLLTASLNNVEAGFETRELDFWRIWVDATASSKWAKMSNRSKYNMINREIKAKFPEIMSDFVAFRQARSATEPKQYGLKR